MGKSIRLTVVLLAAFVSPASGTTWYVDAVVPESGNGQSWETAFKTIQQGIDAASHGDTVLVAEGTYLENIHFNGKNIILTSTDPFNPAIVANTVIDAHYSGPAVTFSGTEDETCVLSGFTTRRGSSEYGGGIYGGDWQHTHARIEDNIIIDNRAYAEGGGVIFCDGVIQGNTITANRAHTGAGLAFCHGIVQNNRICQNQAGEHPYSNGYGAGLSDCHGTIRNNLIAANVAENMFFKPYLGGEGAGLHGCDGVIENNTIVRNTASLGYGGGLAYCNGVIRNCIIWRNSYGSAISGDLYECSLPTYSWRGDPKFVDVDGGDYHLRPDSPSIDAGANFYWSWWPLRDLDGNCRLIGERIDIGCYEYGSTPDSDGDLLSDLDEFSRWTDPFEPDSDADGLRDGLEVLRAINPLWPDAPGVTRVPADMPTIQQALCLALDRDEIVVVPGTYKGNLQFCGTNVVLRSSDPEDPDTVRSTVLDGEGRWSVVSFTGNESEASILSGFTIQNGKGRYGGGVCGGNKGVQTLTAISNNIIAGNSAYWGGGIAYCKGRVQNNTVSGNSAGDGAGLYRCDGIIQHNMISENSASNDGGAMAYCGGFIQNNSFIANSAENGGGALAWCAGHVRSNVVSDNRVMDSFGSGGGFYKCDGAIEGNIILRNLTLGYGGALYACDGPVECNVIAWNSAHGGGGFCSCDGAIRNNTIAFNSAAQNGGGMEYCQGAITNSILWQNIAAQGAQIHEAAEPTYSCVEDWTGEGEGNISEDPRFVDAENGDFPAEGGFAVH